MKLARILQNLSMLLVTLFVLFPIYWTLLKGFFPLSESSFPWDLVPSSPWIDLGRFHALIFEPKAGSASFVRLMLNSTILGLATVAISLPLALLAAYAIARFTFRGRDVLTLTLVGLYSLPGILLVLPLFIIINTLGLINTYAGLLIPFVAFTLPFNIWLLRGYFESIPRSIDESAMIDGAGRFTIIFKILLPLSMPALVAVALLSFLTAYNDFVFTYMFTRSTDLWTVQVGIYNYIEEFRTGQLELPLLYSSSVLALGPILVLYVFLQRYLASGLIAGAVKG